MHHERATERIGVLGAGRAVVAVVVVLLASPARAEGDALMEEARRACEQRDVDRGVAILEKLHAASGHANLLYNQGRCLQEGGRGREAVAAYRRYLSLATGLSEAEIQEVRGFIAALEPPPPPPPPPPPVATPPPVPTALGPEPHAAASPGGWLPDWSRTRWAGAAVAAAGLVAVGVGLIFNGQAGALESEIETKAGRGELEGEALRKKVGEGEDAVVRRNVAYGLGAAALLGGAALFILGESSGGEGKLSLLPALGPRDAGATLRIRF
jgi:hypothetical protein